MLVVNKPVFNTRVGKSYLGSEKLLVTRSICSNVICSKQIQNIACRSLPFDKEKLERARKQVAENTRQIQAELAKKQYEGFDADETVRVVFNGNQVPVSVEITEEAYKTGPEELSKRLTEALKNSHHGSVEGLKLAMTELAKKLGIHGLAGL